MGPDAGIQANNVAQGAAMKALAYERGDVYWDNNRWAVSPEYALEQNWLLATDVHYTEMARRSWTTRLLTDLGLCNSPERAPLSEGIYIFKGGYMRRVRNATIGNPTDSGLEIGPNLRICGAEGGSGANITIEAAGGPASANDGWTIQVLADGFTVGPIGSTVWTWRQNVGAGAKFWCRGATVATPDGVLGDTSTPWRSLIMGKTITAAGTTGDRTGANAINKAAGSVNFASGATTLVVENSLVVAPTSAQTGSIITATVRTNDATMSSAVVVCSANGSFTIHAKPSAPTGEVRVDFAVFTP